MNEEAANQYSVTYYYGNHRIRWRPELTVVNQNTGEQLYDGIAAVVTGSNLETTILSSLPHSCDIILLSSSVLMTMAGTDTSHIMRRPRWKTVIL